jgi:hypothetical protein
LLLYVDDTLIAEQERDHYIEEIVE